MIIGKKEISNISTLAISQLGASHQDTGICEDSSAVYQDSNMAIACVADGHGDSRCFRANLGSKFAVEIGIQCVKEFVANQPNLDFNNEKEIDKAFIQLKSYILFKWLERTKNHLLAHPIEDREVGLMDAEDYEEYQREGIFKSYPVLYGSTFILACVTNGFYFALQLGDGDVAIDNKKFKMPLPEDPRCFGPYTTSLCNDDAIDSFRHYYAKGNPRAIMVSTDGLGKSFAEQQRFLDLLKVIEKNIVETGAEGAKPELIDFFERLTERGSQDDISLGAIVKVGE